MEAVSPRNDYLSHWFLRRYNVCYVENLEESQACRGCIFNDSMSLTLGFNLSKSSIALRLQPCIIGLYVVPDSTHYGMKVKSDSLSAWWIQFGSNATTSTPFQMACGCCHSSRIGELSQTHHKVCMALYRRCCWLLKDITEFCYSSGLSSSHGLPIAGMILDACKPALCIMTVF